MLDAYNLFGDPPQIDRQTDPPTDRETTFAHLRLLSVPKT